MRRPFEVALVLLAFFAGTMPTRAQEIYATLSELLRTPLYKLIKMAFVQQSVEPCVERMAGRTRQCRRCNPQLLLPLPLLPGPHRHTRFYAETFSIRYAPRTARPT
jgi:hypothetical protein